MNRAEFLMLALALQRVPPRPTPAQLRWQREELALFLHFGVNTFTDREWGDGREDRAIFQPERLDPRQWARTARAAGFRAMILTAKHHDGFCLWPSSVTEHHAPMDVVKLFTDACRAEGLGAGLYLSPWDRNAAVYGTPAYNDFYVAQLTELLTRYGQIGEVWFDGAGERMTYDWQRYWSVVKQLQPGSVIFSDAGPDVRWIGNETGSAGDPNWSTVDPDVVPYPGATGDRVIAMLQHGDQRGSVWRPGETDVSIRPGWFYHEREQPKTVEQLMDIYFTSVGRNSKLLLNVPPTRAGLLHDVDVEALNGFKSRRDAMFAVDFCAGKRLRWRRNEIEIDFGRGVTAGMVRLEEDITTGQTVARYRVEGLTGSTWTELASGQTIGYRKLDRFPPVRITRLRVLVDRPVRVGLYAP